MNRACAIHADRPALAERGAHAYCARCVAAQDAALRHVPAQLVQRECFVTRIGADRWRPLEDAGAHFVAHEIGLRVPASGCLAGHPGRLADLLHRLRPLATGEGVRPRDVFVSLDRRRCGVVVRVGEEAEDGLSVAIRTAGLADLRPRIRDLYHDFHGGGQFYR